MVTSSLSLQTLGYNWLGIQSQEELAKMQQNLGVDGLERLQQAFGAHLTAAERERKYRSLSPRWLALTTEDELGVYIPAEDPGGC